MTPRGRGGQTGGSSFSGHPPPKLYFDGQLAVDLAEPPSRNAGATAICEGTMLGLLWPDEGKPCT